MNSQLAKGTFLGVINLLFGGICLYLFDIFLISPTAFIGSWDSQPLDDASNLQMQFGRSGFSIALFGLFYLQTGSEIFMPSLNEDEDQLIIKGQIDKNREQAQLLKNRLKYQRDLVSSENKNLQKLEEIQLVNQ